jgi:GGDEF domain-containing protein
MFSPIQRSKEASTIEVFDAIDASTGLYAAGFMKYKAKSDIESVNRGKRKLSAVLLKLTFPRSIELNLNEDERKFAGVIFGRVVEKSIRACDSGYRIADDEVLLIMLDTPNSGSKIVISRILEGMKRAAAVEHPQCSNAIINYADRDYVGSVDLPSYDVILSELAAALYKKHPEVLSLA